MKKIYTTPELKDIDITEETFIANSDWKVDDEEIVDDQGANQGSVWEESAPATVWDED